MTKEELFQLINDRFEGWELVELLGISAEEICLAFEDEVFRKMKEIKELLLLDEDDEYDDDEETTNYDEAE
jgi:hypothetical protein